MEGRGLYGAQAAPPGLCSARAVLCQGCAPPHHPAVQCQDGISFRERAVVIVSLHRAFQTTYQASEALFRQISRGHPALAWKAAGVWSTQHYGGSGLTVPIGAGTSSPVGLLFPKCAWWPLKKSTSQKPWSVGWGELTSLFTWHFSFKSFRCFPHMTLL